MLSRADFNSDNAAIDAAIKAVENAVANKADASALTSLNSTVVALSSALGSGGSNCRIAWGTYTGTGIGGEGYPSQLTFDFSPVVVMVGNPAHTSYYGWPTTMLRDCTRANAVGIHGGSLTVSWEENAVNWCGETITLQMNDSGTIYYWVAVGV